MGRGGGGQGGGKGSRFTAVTFKLIKNNFLKELLQSEKVIQALKAHQKKVKENKIKEIQERKVKKAQEPPKEATDQGKIPACLITGLPEMLRVHSFMTVYYHSAFYSGQTGI